MWEKLVFVSAFLFRKEIIGQPRGTDISVQVLACAIVFTVFLGCMKLVYTHWRLRKYSAVAERERQEQAMQKRKAQRRPSSRIKSADDVPFGIRAIESGIEVEGVWISRGNTPEPLSRDTSAASSLWEHVPRKDYDFDLERQDLHRSHNPSASDSTVPIVRPDRTSFDRAVSAERLTSTSASRDSSPDISIAKPPRSRHPPSSYTRYSCNPYMLRQSTTTNTLEGLEAIHKASTSIHGDSSTGSSNSSDQSTNSTGDIDPIFASAPGLLTGQPRPKPRHQSLTDFELLNSHRISQAAETGQLTPRGRRPGQSYSADFMSTTKSAPEHVSTERLDYFGSGSKPARTSSENSSLGNGSPNNLVSKSEIGTLPSSIRRASMPDVTPFAQFCKTVSREARPESLRSHRMDTDESSRPKSDRQSVYDSAPSSPIMPASEGATELKLPQPKRSSFEKRASPVVRGHGTGFEILRPGSLNPKIPNEHPMERQKVAPLISLHNASRARSSSGDGPRKLQKKRWPSVDSTTSSNISRHSRVSLLL